MLLKKITFTDGKKLEIHSDDDPMDPRTEFDNLWTFAFFHNRYNLGDKDHGLNADDFCGWEEMEEWIMRKMDGAMVVPVRMYDHSGIGFAIPPEAFRYPYTCQWDSGQVGFAFVTNAKMQEEYKGIDPEDAKQRALNCLRGEIETYNQYHAGDVWGFILRDKPCEHCDDEEGDHLDSCWGFWGSDIETNGILDHLDEQYRTEIQEGKAEEVST